MKYIIALILIFTSYVLPAQVFNKTQYVGRKSTLLYAKGMFTSDSASQITRYTDTTIANFSKIKNHPGAEIWTTDGVYANRLWIRSILANQWIEPAGIGPAGPTGPQGPAGSVNDSAITKYDMKATGNRIQNWMRYDLRIDSMATFRPYADLIRTRGTGTVFGDFPYSFSLRPNAYHADSTLIDGDLVNYNNAYSNAVDFDDAVGGPSMAIQRNGTNLVIERRSMPVVSDTIPLWISNLSTPWPIGGSFYLRLTKGPVTVTQRFRNSMRVVDLYTGVTTFINPNLDTAYVNFTIPDASARNRIRFYVILEPMPYLAPTIIGKIMYKPEVVDSSKKVDQVLVMDLDSIKYIPTERLLGLRGTATLVAGTVTVNTYEVATGALIYVSVNTPGGTQGFLSAPVASVVNKTSFVINSTSASETSTVNYWIVNPYTLSQ